jgi:hypothetical protein
LSTSIVKHIKLIFSAAASAVLGCALCAPAADLSATLGYNRDVRPILSDNCFACHGPDKNKRKGKFRLDDRDSALQKEAFVPGKADESELVERINSADPKEMMPPPESHKKLSDAQKQILRRWIDQGARYEPHWAYIVPTRPKVPDVADGSHVRNPIDAFVVHGLEEKGIAPSPEADRRTLLRRLSLDLIGLPPTPQEIQSFVEDRSPDACEKQVKRLLASPHFGERMAVPWLDAVRFSDTVGFHGDQNQDVFPYRDYVIDAFNHNKPFDRFIIEQLAGDLLPHSTTEQLVATAFNRLNMVTREGGAQPKEYLAKYMADRVRTVGSAFLGSTLNCCECHDHKYDPFTTRDFYSMGAFFADVKQWGVYMDYQYTPNKDLVGWSNDHPFPPEIVVDAPYLQERRAKLFRQIERLVAAFETMSDGQETEYRQWLDTSRQFLKRHDDGWLNLDRIETATTKPSSRPSATRGRRAVDAKRLEFALKPGTIAKVRLQVLPNPRPAMAATTIRFLPSIKDANGDVRSLGVWFADADFKEDVYVNGYSVIGVQNGWKLSSEYSHSTQTAFYLLNRPVSIQEKARLVVSLPRDIADRVRIAVSPVAGLDPLDSPNLEDQTTARLAYLCSTGWDADALREVHALNDKVLECRGGKSPVVVTVSVPPAVTRVLPRGNWQDESGAIVEPSLPHFLPQDGLPRDRRLTRLDLVNWLVSPQNPLTSRVFVNRLWKQFFGTGISNSVEDLGAQGEWPTHPELLDWLAVEFRESGWDVKHMVWLIVTSATYRQSSNLPPSLRESDPNDRLLAAQAPRRLEAEFVRDNALFVAGLIDLEVGGPSVHPYQPTGYWANIQFPDRKYVPEADERQYRRGLYMHWQRTFLHPMLANFDAPSREDGTCTRNVSNTPQQALTLLNDPTFVEAARVLAQKVMTQTDSDAGRLEFLYQRSLCRSVRDNEKQSLLRFLQTQKDYYGAHADDARKLAHVGFAPAAENLDAGQLAAWTQVCRVVLNLHESITRY